MPSYPLILDTEPMQKGWLIEWDTVNLRLLAPDGQLMAESSLSQIQRVIDLRKLDHESQIEYSGPECVFAFKKSGMAAINVRTLVLEALKADPELLEKKRREARLRIVTGIVMFLVCGSVFGLYCWWVSVTPGSGQEWLHYVGGLIRMVLIVCLAGIFAGPYLVIFYGCRLLNLRRAKVRK